MSPRIILCLLAACHLIAVSPPARAQDDSEPFSEFGSSTPKEPGSEGEGVTPGRPFRLAATLSVGWGAFAGTLFRNTSPGLGFQASLRATVSSSLWLNLTARTQETGREDIHLWTGSPGNLLPAERSESVEEYGLLIGGRINPGETGKPMWTIEGGVTGVRMKVTVDPQGEPSVSESLWDPALVLQFGHLRPLGNNFLLDIQGRFGWIPSHGDFEVGGSLYSIHAGLGWVGW